MFIGMTAQESDPIIRLLRASRMAPRGHQVNDQETFLSALSEQSWDLIFCTANQSLFPAKAAMHHLRRLGKDIPVIQLVPNADSHYQLAGLKANFQAVVPLEEKELLIVYVRRELDALEARRNLRTATSELSDIEQRYQQLLESSKTGIAFVDGETILYANESLAALVGKDSAQSLLSTDISHYLSPASRDSLKEHLQTLQKEKALKAEAKLTGLRSDDTEFECQINMRRARHKGTQCIQVSVHLDTHAQEQALQSRLDLVSGLYSAEDFNETLDQTLQAALNGGADCNLLYISLDNFFHIRSEVGTEGCDQLIRDLGQVLRKHVNSAHYSARIDDDVFAVIFKDSNPDRALELAERLRMAIEGNLSESSGTMVKATASIGVASITDNTPAKGELMERIRSTTEEVQRSDSRGNGIKLYQANDELSETQTDMIATLEDAIANSKLKLLFQPIVALSNPNNNDHHYEAFLRLLSDGKEISPNDFQAELDQADINVKIDRWVIKESMIHLQRALKQDRKSRVFINLSSRTLKDRKTLLWFSEMLRRSGLPAKNIVFQFSESDASSFLKHAKFFAETLKRLHCQVCVKHYGTSVNSELVLTQLAPDYVKLDGSYIQELNEEESDDKAFMRMLHKLKVNDQVVIAPLVEGTKVMGTLWKAGVHFVQGHYLQAPSAGMNYEYFDS
ncbi:MAG: EAL domain-containing protein [Pontibacterium sp.]